MIDEKKLLEKLEELKFANEERGYDTAKDVIQEIINLVDEQPKTEWISCEERLPSEEDYHECFENIDGAVWYCTDANIIGLGWYYESTRSWANLQDESPNGKVIAWQPLPQPYKKEGAENG